MVKYIKGSIFSSDKWICERCKLTYNDEYGAKNCEKRHIEEQWNPTFIEVNKKFGSKQSDKIRDALISNPREVTNVNEIIEAMLTCMFEIRNPWVKYPAFEYNIFPYILLSELLDLLVKINTEKDLFSNNSQNKLLALYSQNSKLLYGKSKINVGYRYEKKATIPEQVKLLNLLVDFTATLHKLGIKKDLEILDLLDFKFPKYDASGNSTLLDTREWWETKEETDDELRYKYWVYGGRLTLLFHCINLGFKDQLKKAYNSEKISLEDLNYLEQKYMELQKKSYEEGQDDEMHEFYTMHFFKELGKFLHSINSKVISNLTFSKEAIDWTPKEIFFSSETMDIASLKESDLQFESWFLEKEYENLDSSNFNSELYSFIDREESDINALFGQICVSLESIFIFSERNVPVSRKWYLDNIIQFFIDEDKVYKLIRILMSKKLFHDDNEIMQNLNQIDEYIKSIKEIGIEEAYKAYLYYPWKVSKIS